MISLTASCHAVFCCYHLESRLFSEGKEREDQWISGCVEVGGTRRRGGMAGCDQDILHRRIEKRKEKRNGK